MGLCLICLDEQFSSSYSEWNTIRSQVVIGCVKYLIKQLDNSSNLKTELEKFTLTINNNDILVSFIDIYNKYITQFEEYGLTGVYSLIHKSDNEGSYSVEESTTIIDSIHKLSNYMESRLDILRIFQKSVATKQGIIIE